MSASDDWAAVDVDLADFIGQTIFLRFVFDAVAPIDSNAADLWRVGSVRIERR